LELGMSWLSPVVEWSRFSRDKRLISASKTPAPPFFSLPDHLWSPEQQVNLREPLALCVARLAALSARSSPAQTEELRAQMRDAVDAGRQTFSGRGAFFSDESQKPERLCLAAFSALCEAKTHALVDALEAAARRAARDAIEPKGALGRAAESVVRLAGPDRSLPLEQWRLRRHAARHAGELAREALAAPLKKAAPQ
jgi:hypothetical protein